MDNNGFLIINCDKIKKNNKELKEIIETRKPIKNEINKKEKGSTFTNKNISVWFR